MRLLRRRSVIALAAAALLLALFAVLLGPNPLAVEVASVARGSMTVTVSSEGQTRVKEEYEVAAPLGGRLLRSGLKAGDKVAAGQTVVAIIQPPQPQFHDFRSKAELEAKLRAAEALYALAQADLERTKAEFQFAKRELDRNRALSGMKVISARNFQESERDASTREANVTVAENALRQRASELEAAKASLVEPNLNGEATQVQDPVELRAPVSGRVLIVMKESETVVTPGMPILKLGNVHNIEVMLEMLSEDAVKVRDGAAATVEAWGGARLNARVRRVEPFGFTKISALGVEEQRVRVLLDFTDPPEAWQALGHGYRVTAHIEVWQGDTVLKLPVGALFRDGNRWACFVVRDRTAELRHIEIGHLTQAEAEVLGGVSEGEEVILHPSDRITNGIAVNVRR